MRFPRKLVRGANLARNIALGRSMTRRTSFLYAAKNVMALGGALISVKTLGGYAIIDAVQKIFECAFPWAAREKQVAYYYHLEAPLHSFNHFTNTWAGFGNGFDTDAVPLDSFGTAPMVPGIGFYTYGDEESRAWNFVTEHPNIYAYIYYMNDVPNPVIGDYDYSAKPGLTFPEDYDYSAYPSGSFNEEIIAVDNFIFDVAGGNFAEIYSGITTNPKTGAQACCLSMGLEYVYTIEYDIDPVTRGTFNDEDYYIEVSAFNLATDQAYRIIYKQYWRGDPLRRDITHPNAIVDNNGDLHVFARANGTGFGQPSNVAHSLNGSNFSLIRPELDLENEGFPDSDDGNYLPRVAVTDDNTVYAMYVTASFGDIVLCKRDPEGVFTVRHFFYDEPYQDIFIYWNYGWDFCARGNTLVIFGPESTNRNVWVHVSFDGGDTWPIKRQLEDVLWTGSGSLANHLNAFHATFVEASPNGQYWVFGGYQASSQIPYLEWMFHFYEQVNNDFIFRGVYTLEDMIEDEVLAEDTQFSANYFPTAAIDDTGCCKIKFFLSYTTSTVNGQGELYHAIQIQDLDSYVV